MGFRSKFSGQEVEDLLTSVSSGIVVSVDTKLSDTSENPVQNKVINSAIESLGSKNQELLDKVEKLELEQSKWVDVE